MSQNFIGGLFFVTFIFFSSFFGCIFMMGPTLPLLIFKPEWFRWANDKLIGSWLPLPPAVLEIFFGTKLFITTKNFPPGLNSDKAVIIMNHRTRLDWLYYWSVILRQGNLEHEKIILKDELKHIPGAGWAMQAAMFIFIQRKWEKDERYLHQILHYFTDHNYPLQLLLFPEGTNFGVHSVSKSKAYAIKNNLPIYNHVLHPRLRGFTYCVEQLRQYNGLDAIYDVTVAYSGNICCSESDLLMGNFPQDIHFHVKRYSIEEIPESHEGLEEWCVQKWAEKEDALENFHKNGRFGSTREEKGSAGQELSAWRWMMFWIVYWLTFVSTVLVLLYCYSFVRWYALLVGVFFFMQSSFGGGLENLQVSRHSISNKWSNHQNNYSLHSNLDRSFENGNRKGHTT